MEARGGKGNRKWRTHIVIDTLKLGRAVTMDSENRNIRKKCKSIEDRFDGHDNPSGHKPRNSKSRGKIRQ